MKPLAILILAALPLLTGCYTTSGYYGGRYGYEAGSSYYYGGSYGYVSRPPYLGFGYPYAYKHHYRHSGIRSHKYPIRKGHSPHHRFHRPNFKSRHHFNRATATYRGSQKHRFKQRSFSRHHYRGSGRVSGVVITVPGRISGVIVSAPAAVSVGQPHSAAVSAGEILTSTMRRR